ncbi:MULTISPECIES: hypothetical protein [unclassified Vibrio]|uniref:hypothetical protein n=1 Tax=unclassified Vibrio TaxID=2614977 RepID=UPI001361D6C7|nr:MULTISPECIES: hypothetical protein [unclassified Vibrio]NAW57708.1 hypothetical protein [Vibrio sp. V36_P2S2PM302]NAX28320.1 hypothetical protein [Vibrio sp. V38_P2S17PM301]NAX29069.1 hypothetical protein [Vibrio sp. V37_P2S8PM304]
MNKRRLPLPLILLIPIVLLVIVAIAGVYRFSLSDEEILAKFPAQKVSADPIVDQVFSIQSANPWTIEVPQSKAFAFIDQYDPDLHQARGRYDDGIERGQVVVDTQRLIPWTTEGDALYLAPMVVSNQGSGAFYYLTLFRFDSQRSRMVVADTHFLGDRIEVTAVTAEPNGVRVNMKVREAGQSMADAPMQSHAILFAISSQAKLLKTQ